MDCAAGTSAAGSASADGCVPCEAGSASSGDAACTECSWSIFIVGSGIGGDKVINLAEVQAFDSSGSLITPAGAELFSTSAPAYQAEECIDGSASTFCHSDVGGAEEYLRVDYVGFIANLASIVVTNREAVNLNEVERIVGARIRVNLGQPSSNTMAAESALWSDDFTAASSTFTFTPPPNFDCGQ
jgi:hypothetical protein